MKKKSAFLPLLRIIWFMSCLLLATHVSRAQAVLVMPATGTASLRGLSVVSDNIVWTSGSGGTVGRSLNGGRFFEWMKVPGYAHTEFRDIYAFSDREAIIMGITDPAVILRTTDAGKTWTTVYKDKRKDAFFDAIDFRGDSGMLIGDPTNRKPLLLQTADRGVHWTPYPSPVSLSDTAEAFFAASGSNLLAGPGNYLLFVSGGARSFIYYGNGRKDSLPLLQGAASTGANAIAADPSDPGHFYIVGGDFSHDTLKTGSAVAVRLTDSTATTELPQTFPSGYKSSVCFLDAHRMVSCGTSGVDVSTDGGKNWRRISAKSFHVCAPNVSRNRIFLAGSKGAFGVIVWP